MTFSSNSVVSGGSRIRELDGLRGIAFMLVTIGHAFPDYSELLGTGLGEAGVQVFFVLSGLLITRILIKERRRAEAGGVDKRRCLFNFYVRRFIRLTPLLYVVLMISILLGVDSVLSSWPWQFTYLSNVHDCLYGPGGWGANLWTLAVEEQFYLVWPWLVFFVPQKRLPGLFIGVCLAAPVARYILWGYVDRLCVSGTVGRLPFASMDFLAAGALVAWLQTSATINWRGWLNAVGLFGLVAWWVLPDGGLVAASVRDSALAAMWVWVVVQCDERKLGSISGLLTAGPLYNLGLISYGAYVIQGFVGAWWYWFVYACPIPGYRVLPRLGITEAVYTQPSFIILVTFVLNLVFAAIMWHAIEKPLNRQRERFVIA